MLLSKTTHTFTNRQHLQYLSLPTVSHYRPRREPLTCSRCSRKTWLNYMQTKQSYSVQKKNSRYYRRSDQYAMLVLTSTNHLYERCLAPVCWTSPLNHAVSMVSSVCRKMKASPFVSLSMPDLPTSSLSTH